MRVAYQFETFIYVAFIYWQILHQQAINIFDVSLIEMRQTYIEYA